MPSAHEFAAEIEPHLLYRSPQEWRNWIEWPLNYCDIHRNGAIRKRDSAFLHIIQSAIVSRLVQALKSRPFVTVELCEGLTRPIGDGADCIADIPLLIAGGDHGGDPRLHAARFIADRPAAAADKPFAGAGDCLRQLPGKDEGADPQPLAMKTFRAPGTGRACPSLLQARDYPTA